MWARAWCSVRGGEVTKSVMLCFTVSGLRVWVHHTLESKLHVLSWRLVVGGTAGQLKHKKHAADMQILIRGSPNILSKGHRNA